PHTARRRHRRLRGGQPSDCDGVARPVQLGASGDLAQLAAVRSGHRAADRRRRDRRRGIVSAARPFTAYRAALRTRHPRVAQRTCIAPPRPERQRERPGDRQAAGAASTAGSGRIGRRRPGKTNPAQRCRRAPIKDRRLQAGMSVIVKICGLSTPEALDVALDAGADMVGFVFFAPSPRHLTFERAHALASRVLERAQKVALTVDADDALLDTVVEALQPDMLQLHGTESPARVEAVRRMFGLPVMKALTIAAKSDLDGIARYAGIADRLLFDARAPREATRPGGLGRPFDWHLLENLDPGVPFMLSGGLDAANVGEALRITRAPGVDVSSGVERAPGEKDPDKIRAFVRAARV